MTTYYSTSQTGSLSVSPYGALMYARSINPDVCVHDIIDVESDDLRFEDRPMTSVEYSKRNFISAPRYWDYKHKKLLDKPGCWGGIGGPPGSTRCW